MLYDVEEKENAKSRHFVSKQTMTIAPVAGATTYMISVVLFVRSQQHIFAKLPSGSHPAGHGLNLALINQRTRTCSPPRYHGLAWTANHEMLSRKASVYVTLIMAKKKLDPVLQLAQCRKPCFIK